MRRRLVCRVLSLAALAALAAPAACGSSAPQRPDYGPVDDVPTDDVETGLSVHFLNPPEDVEKVQSGVLEVTIRITDIASDALTLVLDVPGESSFTALQQPVPKPGDYKVNVDTTLIKDGRKKTLRAVVTTVDERTAEASLLMTVDNHAPTISLIGLTPEEGANALGEVHVQAKVTDAGSGVTKVLMRVEDSWSWESPTLSGQPKSTLDSGSLRIPTASWTGGPKVLTITAYDGVEGHETVLERNFDYVQLPSFQGATAYPLPADYAAKDIDAVRLSDTDNPNLWGVVAAGGGGVAIFVRDGESEAMVQRVQLWKTGCDKVLVADVDGDGLQDILASCAPAGTLGLTVALFLQQDTGDFAKPVTLTPPATVLNMATGDVNDDGVADIALVTSNAAQNMSLTLSEVTDAGPKWGAFFHYSGALDPNLVAIGQWVPGSKRNAVLVGREGWSTVTTFSIGPDGTLLSGVNTLLSDTTGLGMGALVSTSFKGDPGKPEAALVGVTQSGQSRVMELAVKDTPLLREVASWSTGLQPRQIVSGDVTGDGVPEVVALCIDSDLIHVWKGAANGNLTTIQKMLAGPARDVALADLDSDGVLDVVTLPDAGDGLGWVRFDTDKARFAGAEMVINPMPVASVVQGNFSKRLSGAGQKMRDVALMSNAGEAGNLVQFLVADAAIGLPVIPGTPMTTLAIPQPRQMVAANVNPLNAVYPGPTDLVITSNHGGAPTPRPKTGTVLLVDEDTQSHESIVATAETLDFGDQPILVAVGDLGWASGATGLVVPDLAFLVTVTEEDGTTKAERIQPFLGDGKGGFSRFDANNVPLDPPKIAAARTPVDLQAFGLRTPMSYATAKPPTPYYVDLFTANGNTGDVTVFPAQGGGRYNANRPELWRTFAMGNGPQAVRAGYMRLPVDGSADATAAGETFPDLVTLLDTDVAVAFNTNTNRAQLVSTPEALAYDPPQRLGHKGRGPVDLALADMNRDGYLDIVVLNKDSGTVTVYVNLASRAFSAPYDFPVGVGPVKMAVGDLDGNDCPDVVTADNGGQTLTFLKNLVPCE